MKNKIDDDDLIITNVLEADTENSLPEEGLPKEGDTTNTLDDAADIHDGKGSVGTDDDTQSLREALSNIHEDDAIKPQVMTLNKILAGDFFTSQIMRRQMGLVLVCAFIILLYISNRYTCQRQMIEIDKLKKELLDAKYKALSTSSMLTEKSRQSNVLNMLKLCNDSTLHTADQAPFIIQVPEE